MNKFNRSLMLSSAILASSLTSTYAQAAPFGLEARSLGMGNVSVATADIATAALANPAMLSYQPLREDFSLLLSGGLMIDDSAGMIDALDRYQAINDQVLSAPVPVDVPSTNALIVDVNNLNVITDDINNKFIAPHGIFAGVVGFSGEEYSFAFSARSDVSAISGLDGYVLQPHIGSISLDTEIPAKLTEINNVANATRATSLVVLGVETTELGLSIAKNFELGGQKVSFGITPKVVSVKRTLSFTPIETVDTGNLLDSDDTSDLGEVTSLDAGVVVQMSENTQVGLVIKNLIENDIDYNDIFGAGTISLSSQAKLGIAYRGDFFTIGADLDLMESESSITGALIQSPKTKMLSVGAEINAWDVVQLRLGVQQNMADDLPFGYEDQLVSVGAGLWLGFNLDVAVMAGENVVGAIANAGFKF